MECDHMVERSPKTARSQPPLLFRYGGLANTSDVVEDFDDVVCEVRINARARVSGLLNHQARIQFVAGSDPYVVRIESLVKCIIEHGRGNLDATPHELPFPCARFKNGLDYLQMDLFLNRSEV